MVKEENAHYHNVNKFVVAFLNASAFATPELIVGRPDQQTFEQDLV